MINLAEHRNKVVAVAAVVALVGLTLVGVQCSRHQTAQAVTAGSGVAELICAVLLEPNGTEREICDTGARLAELLGKLLEAGVPAEPAESAPAAAPSVSAPEPAASTDALRAARARATASALPVDAGAAPRVRLLRLYVKRGDQDAALGGDASEAGAVDSPGMVPGEHKDN